MSSNTNGLNIWYCHPYAGGPALGLQHRPYELAKAWIKNGNHAPIIIFPRFHHILAKDTPLPGFIRVGEVDFLALPSMIYRGNGMGRILHMTQFSLLLASRTSALCASGRLHKPDVVIASSPHPFSIYGARRLADKYKAILVYEMRDLWPLTLVELGAASRFHPLTMLCKATEKYALRHADLVSSVLPKACDYLREQGWGHKPYVWVPNGIRNLANTTNSPASSITTSAIDQLKSWRSRGKLCLVYVGSMGPPNGIERLLLALGCESMVAAKDRLGVLLVGSAKNGTPPSDLLRASKVDINWSGSRIPSGEVGLLLQHADFAYAGILHKPNLYRYGLSMNKLPEYLDASLPVILPCAPCGDVVSESGGGFAESAPGPEELASLILRMVQLPSEERRRMGERGREHVRRNYSYRSIGQTYLQAMQMALQSKMT
jgi:glycosyltransferase involved in cell wall biosynthesis